MSRPVPLDPAVNGVEPGSVVAVMRAVLEVHGVVTVEKWNEYITDLAVKD